MLAGRRCGGANRPHLKQPCRMPRQCDRHGERAPEAHSDRRLQNIGATRLRPDRPEQGQECERRDRHRRNQPGRRGDENHQKRHQRANGESSSRSHCRLDGARRRDFRDAQLVAGVRPERVLRHRLFGDLVGEILVQPPLLIDMRKFPMNPRDDLPMAKAGDRFECARPASCFRGRSLRSLQGA